MESVIAAKFDPPVWMGNQLRRDTLLRRLDGALTHRLTLVHGPAGYGKTSLLGWSATIATSSV
jgi:LuxR family maltose regulon positive regulatory protein